MMSNGLALVLFILLVIVISSHMSVCKPAYQPASLSFYESSCKSTYPIAYPYAFTTKSPIIGKSGKLLDEPGDCDTNEAYCTPPLCVYVTGIDPNTGQTIYVCNACCIS